MKKKVSEYNYGNCDICDTPMRERLIKQDFWIRGDLIVVENVPAGVCPRCGEKIVNSEVGQWIAKLIECSEWIEKAPRISVPTIPYKAEHAKV